MPFDYVMTNKVKKVPVPNGIQYNSEVQLHVSHTTEVPTLRSNEEYKIAHFTWLIVIKTYDAYREAVL